MDQSLQLTGKTALVTGSSRGIGLAIATELGLAGASVMLSSRKEATLQLAAEKLRQAGIERLAYVVANAGDTDAAETAVRHTMDRFGSVDILVNNAATNPYFGPVMGIDQSRANKIIQVNLLGPIWWTQSAWHHWMKDNGGVVINIASASGLVTEDGIAFYAVSKAALIHLTRQLASELAPSVRVNGIAPGLVKTDMARALWEREEHQLSLETPLQRLGMPRDIGQLALFLASETSSWLTGQTITVDGGATIKPLSTGAVRLS